MRCTILAELDRIADQILKQLDQLQAVRHDGWQGLDVDLGTALLDRAGQPIQRLLQGRRTVHPCQRLRLGGDARIGQDVVDHALHAHGTVDRESHEFPGIGIELVGQTLLQQLHVADDHAQGLLQVVRGNIGELLEFRVGARQRVGQGLQRRTGLALPGDVGHCAQHARRSPGFIANDLALCLNPVDALVRTDHPTFDKEPSAAKGFLESMGKALAIFRHEVACGDLPAPLGRR